MGLFGSSFKLSEEQKELYYETLKDIYKVLGDNYIASALMFENLKVLELHTDKKIVKKDFERMTVEVVKRLKKLKTPDFANIDSVYPFKTLILSLVDNFITIISSEKFHFSFFCKNDFSIGCIYNIVMLKAIKTLEELEKDNEEERIDLNQNID